MTHYSRAHCPSTWVPDGDGKHSLHRQNPPPDVNPTPATHTLSLPHLSFQVQSQEPSSIPFSPFLPESGIAHLRLQQDSAPDNRSRPLVLRTVHSPSAYLDNGSSLLIAPHFVLKGFLHTADSVFLKAKTGFFHSLPSSLQPPCTFRI